MAEHVHDFKPHKKTVLLARYKTEDGEMKYQATVGNDTLKQLKCACNETVTLDLERKIL